MILKNGSAFCGGKFIKADIKIENEKITEISQDLNGENIIDCGGKYIIPGLIDLHTHGCVGFDFADASEIEIEKMLDFYMKNGTTSLLATVISLPKSDYFSQFPRLIKHINSQNKPQNSQILGINLEGPFLSMNKRGSHNPKNIAEVDLAFAKELWQRSGENIRLMTVAPELENSHELAEFAKGKFKLSLGHTQCGYDCAKAALMQDFSHCTHLFNAMSPLKHREPGAVAACLESNATKELICDGVHIADGVIRAMLKGYGGEIAMVSDSISPCGMLDGGYLLGGMAVTVEGNRATLLDGTIAGSCATLFECLRHAIEIGCDINTAVSCATEIPAKAIGIEKTHGKIAQGYNADLLVLDENFKLQTVYKNGNIPH